MALAAGSSCCLALKADGSVVAWGPLGNANYGSPSPTRVPGNMTLTVYDLPGHRVSRQDLGPAPTMCAGTATMPPDSMSRRACSAASGELVRGIPVDQRAACPPKIPGACLQGIRPERQPGRGVPYTGTVAFQKAGSQPGSKGASSVIWPSGQRR